MIPFGIAIGLMMVLFGLSQALEMIVNTRRNAAVEDQPLICAKCDVMAEVHYHLTNWGRWMDLCPAHASEWMVSQEVVSHVE